ncbi:DUF5343 domain-containing protein [Allobranchiibius sp. GilTou38]|uniref:DUF5343 domain-containing protein n=1 Tax=Allobranchiibius sp. GilTou38 TaxID=2815210 RepID=UPI001AA0EFC7|nr:DUF5343 domain-containing protein [Allobranchiibius sp. GilTou38]MBO1765449.1 DUF5343 domain-containing protein [Allobranchiibius sp. GilTou38]
MADDGAEKRSYPYLSASVWWELRKRFQRSLPGTVSLNYLQSVFGVSEKSARNYLPQLRLLGLVDADSKPTPLANKWRNDDTYAEACAEIGQKVYPAELREAFSDADEEQEGVARWFMSQGAGQASAGVQARFAALLGRADPAEGANQTSAPARKTTKTSPPDADKTTKAAVPEGAATVQKSSESGSDAEQQNAPALPTVHIDLQVHIAADAGPNQIDAVFASMAKHLYGRG